MTKNLKFVVGLLVLGVAMGAQQTYQCFKSGGTAACVDTQTGGPCRAPCPNCLVDANGQVYNRGSREVVETVSMNETGRVGRARSLEQCVFACEINCERCQRTLIVNAYSQYPAWTRPDPNSDSCTLPPRQ